MSRKKHSPAARPEDIPQDPGSKAEVLRQDAISLYAGKVKEVTGTFAGVTGISYALGFLITNIHLNAKYGIYDFTLIKARYIYTGFTFLLLCLMAVIGSFLLLQIADLEAKSFRSYVAKIGRLLFTWLMTSSIFSLSLKGLLAIVESGRLEAMREFPITFWFWLAIPSFAFQIWFVRRGGPKSFDIPMPISSSVFTSVVFLAAIYGLFHYQLLPFSLGGGMPIPIQMVADEGKIRLLQQLIPIENENVTEIVYLVEQSDTSYFVLVGSANSDSFVRPVEVSKSLIIGIMHPLDVPLPTITHDRILNPNVHMTPAVSVTPTMALTATLIPTP